MSSLLRFKGHENAWKWIGEPWSESEDGVLLPSDKVTDFQSEESIALHDRAALSDFSLTARYRMSYAGENYAGIAFRVMDARRFYWAVMYPLTGRPATSATQGVRLYRSEPSGFRTELAARERIAPFEWDKWYEIRVECEHDRITVFIDNTLAIAARDASYPAGFVGITGQGPVAFQDVVLTGRDVDLDWDGSGEQASDTHVGKRICPDLSMGRFQGTPSAVLLANGELLVGFQVAEKCFAGGAKCKTRYVKDVSCYFPVAMRGCL